MYVSRFDVVWYIVVVVVVVVACLLPEEWIIYCSILLALSTIETA